MTEFSHIEAIEKELKQIESSNAWNQVYQKVRSDGTYDFALTEARSAINRPLNRYRDVLPYDHSRIILQHPTTDYINASLVKVESIQRQYILTQGPLSVTSQHFWLMVWQQQCKGIVMLNKIIEKNIIKCDQYWPMGEKNGGQDSFNFPGVGLKVDLVTEDKHHHYVLRTLRLTECSSGSSREILHFHYTTWPDFGVPQSPEAFNKFLGVVIASGCLDPSVGPPIVHCSAGIGRSGTFCLVDTLLVMLERGLCSNNVGTVLEVLLDMRRYRMGLIQTPDQLRFSYQAIVHAATQRYQRTHSTNTNGSLGNGLAGSSSSSCEDLSSSALDVDSPPPPPMRTDSLTRSMIEAQLHDRLQGSDTDEEEEDDDSDVDELPHLHGQQGNEDLAEAALPAVPPSPGTPPPPPRPPPAASPITAAPASPERLAVQMASEVRRRRQQERQASLSSKVAAIKDKTNAAEAWQYKKRASVGEDGERGASDADQSGEPPSKKPKKHK